MVLHNNFFMTRSVIAQGRYHSVIKGIVVDEKRHPVPGAILTFDNSESRTNKCWIANNLDSNKVIADGAGKFFFNEYCDRDNRKIVLFAEKAARVSQPFAFSVH